MHGLSGNINGSIDYVSRLQSCYLAEA